MNAKQRIISAEEARRLLGPKSLQLSDRDVRKLVKVIASMYEDYSQKKKLIK